MKKDKMNLSDYSFPEKIALIVTPFIIVFAVYMLFSILSTG